MSELNERGRGWLGLGALLALGLILGGWILGAQIKAMRLADRYVTVKGLVEKTVKSDLAIWPVGYKEAGDDLQAVYAKSEADKQVVLQFLKDQGIQPSEIEIGLVRVIDTQANEYGGGARAPHRYIIDQQITVRTNRVDQVAAAAQKTMQLVQKGIVLGGGQGPGTGTNVQVHFVELNQAGHDYRSNAKCASGGGPVCIGFGQQGGSDPAGESGRVHDSACGARGGGSEGAEGAYLADSSLMKTVRVVTSVDYYLNN